MTRAALLFLFVLPACGSGESPPPVRPGEERTRFTEYSVPGLTLWTVSGHEDDHGWSSVVAIDASGHTVPAATLFSRAVTPGMPAETVARRAIQILGIDGGLVSSAEEVGHWGRPETRALVVPPVVTDGVLTMWMLKGEMSPDLQRVQVVLATAAVSQQFASELLPPPAPPAPPTPAAPPPDVAPAHS